MDGRIDLDHFIKASIIVIAVLRDIFQFSPGSFLTLGKCLLLPGKLFFLFFLNRLLLSDLQDTAVHAATGSKQCKCLLDFALFHEAVHLPLETIHRIIIKRCIVFG